MITDLELVAQTANAGNKKAYAQLVERHQSRIRQFLRRLTAGDWHRADDLAQDTFLLAYRKIHQFKASGNFSSWLHSIAWRQFLSSQRKKVRQAEVPMLEELPTESGKLLEAEMTAQRLMLVLNENQRVAITLSYAEGMTHEQISEITGMALGTVKSHLSRGILKMKKWVENHDQSVDQAPIAAGMEGKRHVG